MIDSSFDLLEISFINTVNDILNFVKIEVTCLMRFALDFKLVRSSTSPSPLEGEGTGVRGVLRLQTKKLGLMEMDMQEWRSHLIADNDFAITNPLNPIADSMSHAL